MAVILGIDTSNYTSSLSIVSGNKLISDRRKLLNVEKSKIGLRQSEAVFQHIHNLPYLMSLVKQDIKDMSIDAIGVSNKPRPVEDSYMPVFKVGESFADFLSACLNIPVFKTSHQEGHIEAGIYSTNMNVQKSFIALHLSGGTSEILKVEPKDSCKPGCFGFSIQIIGGSDDLSAGQFIDRAGVSLGFDFPAGKAVDDCALEGSPLTYKLSYSTRCGNMSFSGPETAVSKLISKGAETNDISASVMECISDSIINALKWCVKEYNINDVLFAGGVSSSRYIQKHIKDELKAPQYNIHFCSPMFCTDNSVGTAFLCSKAFNNFGL